MAHYIDAAISGAANYVRLGKDLEEFKVNLNPTVEKKKNIMGEVSGGVSSYEPEGAVDTYYAETGTQLFAKLQDIIDNRKLLDDCNTRPLKSISGMRFLREYMLRTVRMRSLRFPKTAATIPVIKFHSISIISAIG